MAIPIDPIDVPGCIADWDIDNVVDSSGASSLPDRSANSNDLAQATGSSRLAIVSSDADFNGHKSMQGASGDFISRATLTGGDLVQPYTVYAVIRTGSNVTTEQVILGSATSSGRFDIAVTSSRIRCRTGTNNEVSTVAGVDANSTGIVRAVYSGAATSIEWIPVGAATLSAVGSGNVTNGIGFKLMTSASNSAPFLGKLARSSAYAGILSADYDARIKAFLTQRYGFWVTLAGQSIITAKPQISAPGFTQGHVLSGKNLATGQPAITSSPLANWQALSGRNISTGAPIISSSGLTWPKKGQPMITQWLDEDPRITQWLDEDPRITEWA